MTDTQALIARLEQATGPDRELDRAIAKAFAIMPIYELRGQIGGSWPDYTASIDAALTLVPEGWFLDLKVRKRCSHAFLERDYEHTEVWADNAPTPALAIVIAALRAKGDA